MVDEITWHIFFLIVDVFGSGPARAACRGHQGTYRMFGWQSLDGMLLHISLFWLHRSVLHVIMCV